MKLKIFVTLKPGVLDPQGKAIQHALGSLGFAGVDDVRAARIQGVGDPHVGDHYWQVGSEDIQVGVESLSAGEVGSGVGGPGGTLTAGRCSENSVEKSNMTVAQLEERKSMHARDNTECARGER